MTRSSRTPRRLVVGDETFLWSVRHEHHGEDGRYEDCRDVLTIRRPGALGRLQLVFEDTGDAGGSGGTRDHPHPDPGASHPGRPDLHEPATVRALLAEARARGCRIAGDATEQLDGWPLSAAAPTPAATAARSAARSDPRSGQLS